MTSEVGAVSDANLPLEERMQLIALRVLAESGGPSGALSLASAFRNAGIDVAEATAGRYLRQLDELGYTRSLGKRGRMLTLQGENSAGGTRPERQPRRPWRTSYGRSRRQHDRAAHRPAACAPGGRDRGGRASGAACDGYRGRGNRRGGGAACRLRRDQQPGGISHNFHELISRYSHNEMLAAMTMMLLDPQHDPLVKLLDHIADDTGTAMSMALDHPRIAEAIRERDSGEAEHAMRRHLDKLITVVLGYRDSRPPRS